MKVKNEVAMQQKFMEHIKSASTKVLSITLVFDNEPNSTGWKMYRPESWEVATGVSGYSLLMAHPDIGFFSLGFFNLGIVRWQVPITSEPSNCLKNITEDDFTKSITNLLSSGFKTKVIQNMTELPSEALICRELAIVRGKTVVFEFACCKGNGYCPDNEPDFWQKALFYSMMVLGIIAFLYVANLVPEYLYRDKYGYKIFYHDLDDVAEFKVLDNTSDKIPTDAELETEALHATKKGSKCMSSLDNLVRGDNYKVKGVWFRVPNVRVVSKSYLPIGLFIYLYQRLIRCTCNTYRGHATPSLRVRQLSSLGDQADGKSLAKSNESKDFNIGICCDLPVCNPDPEKRLIRVRSPSWNMILQIFTAVLSSTIFAIPWILIYSVDDDLIEGKRGNYAYEKGLIYRPPPYAFNLLRFVKSTVPGLSIACIIIYVICIIVICIILTYDRTEREYVGKRIRSTLRDAKDRWDKGVINSSNLYVTLFLPFKILRNYGLLALLLWPLWIVTVCPFSIFVVILGNTPTVNIFFRLLKLFMIDIVYIFKTKQIRINTLSSVVRCILYGSLILVLIIVHFLTLVLLALLVNVIGYTLAGIIVTANETFRYTTFSLLIILNAYDVFQNVEKRYLVFNEKIQAAIITKTKERIKKIAKSKAESQPNIALKVKIDTDEEMEQELDLLWENMAISDKNKILFNARSVIQFLDKDDEVFLSEKFFFEACYMNYYGCPGDFSTSLIDATRRVLIIIIFLVFVLFTLNAFGGLAAFSASGLLITLSWGLLPLLINRFFTNPMPELSLDTDDFNFQNKLDSLIYEFAEYWEVVDLDVEKLEDLSDEKNELKRSQFWLRLNDSNAVQISVPMVGISEPFVDPEPELDAQPLNETRPDDIEMKMLDINADGEGAGTSMDRNACNCCI